MADDGVSPKTRVDEDDGLTSQEREHKKKVEALYRRLKAGWRRV